MKSIAFTAKLQQVQAARGSNLALLMIPRLAQMPLPMQRYDDPFLPFAKAIINATRDLVCAYVFDLAAYLALGAAGAVALERSVAYVGEDNLTVLHAWFAGQGYVAVAQAFGVDAVTLADKGYIDAYRTAGVGVFEVDSPSLIGEAIEMRLYGEEVLYAGHDDDFADQTRAVLLRRLP